MFEQTLGDGQRHNWPTEQQQIGHIEISNSKKKKKRCLSHDKKVREIMN